MADAARVADLVDTSTFRDDGRPGVTGRRITGVRVVLEHCARAVITPRGVLTWARTRGFDLRQLENSDLTVAERGQVKGALDLEILGVDFVRGVLSTLRWDPTSYRLDYLPAVRVADSGQYPLAVSLSRAAGVLVDFGGVW